MNLPRKGEVYRCFTVIQTARGWGGAYGQTWRPSIWECRVCGYRLHGDRDGWLMARMADHHECGHTPCERCGKPLLRRKDGSPRQHQWTQCAGKSAGHKIEREFVKNMTAREYA